MELLLNNILKLTEEEIDNSKIEFNMQAGSGGQPFIGDGMENRGISILDNGFSALQECKRMSGCLYL